MVCREHQLLLLSLGAALGYASFDASLLAASASGGSGALAALSLAVHAASRVPVSLARLREYPAQAACMHASVAGLALLGLVLLLDCVRRRLVLRALLAVQPWAHGRANKALVLAHGLAVKAAHPLPESTFALQKSLPRLPVPPLKQTAERYLRSLRPLLDDAAFAPCTADMAAFVRGVGPALQRKLLLRSYLEDNWLTEWWLKYAYLCSPASEIAVKSNWYAIAPVPDADVTQAVRAAAWMPLWGFGPRQTSVSWAMPRSVSQTPTWRASPVATVGCSLR